MKPAAIDFHTHPQTEEMLKAAGARVQQMARYFGRERKPVSFQAMADMYRERQMMAVILNTNDETTEGTTPVPNDHLAAAQRDHPDVFVAFGAIDPWLGAKAVAEVRRCHEELGMRGIGELNPGRQAFHPNDRRFYPIWEEAAKRGLIVLFHTGMMGAGAGTPGGMGYRLSYTRPIPALDDVAAEFSELKIVAAHPAWPWHLESLAIALHKSNYYIDLSGWAPKYIPPEVVQHADTRLSRQVLFGTDWPALSLDRYLEEFKALELRPESRRRIELDNAIELLGLAVGDDRAG